MARTRQVLRQGRAAQNGGVLQRIGLRPTRLCPHPMMATIFSSSLRISMLAQNLSRHTLELRMARQPVRAPGMTGYGV
ncbi:hypothetical protein DT23_03090 [Thioclava indica]|uniref:Uncharacterized protein n=1 Tax=Thioclava indica TaxID=1353528 RepID=A0A074JY21_9RHOB|nr:hypothetical protein DT23_03090 [Thioclava indica]